MGLSIFKYFSFTTQVPDQDAKLLASQAMTRATELQGKLIALEAQVSALQNRVDSIQNKRKAP
jgi:peptidoglycan hydrolase CwlO-like protein